VKSLAPVAIAAVVLGLLQLALGGSPYVTYLSLLVGVNVTLGR
jgi:hypothetical protein